MLVPKQTFTYRHDLHININLHTQATLQPQILGYMLMADYRNDKAINNPSYLLI